MTETILMFGKKKKEQASSGYQIGQDETASAPMFQGQSLFASEINPPTPQIDFGFGQPQAQQSDEAPAGSPMASAVSVSEAPVHPPEAAPAWAPEPEPAIDFSAPADEPPAWQPESIETPSASFQDVAAALAPPPMEPPTYTPQPQASPLEHAANPMDAPWVEPGAATGDTEWMNTPTSFDDPAPVGESNGNIPTPEASVDVPPTANDPMNWDGTPPAFEAPEMNAEAIEATSDPFAALEEALPPDLPIGMADTTIPGTESLSDLPSPAFEAPPEPVPQAPEPFVAPVEQALTDPSTPASEAIWNTLPDENSWTPGEQVATTPEASGQFLDQVTEQLYPEGEGFMSTEDLLATEQAFADAANFLFPETATTELEWNEPDPYVDIPATPQESATPTPEIQTPASEPEGFPLSSNTVEEPSRPTPPPPPAADLEQTFFVPEELTPPAPPSFEAGDTGLGENDFLFPQSETLTDPMAPPIEEPTTPTVSFGSETQISEKAPQEEPLWDNDWEFESQNGTEPSSLGDTLRFIQEDPIPTTPDPLGPLDALDPIIMPLTESDTVATTFETDWDFEAADPLTPASATPPAPAFDDIASSISFTEDEQDFGHSISFEEEGRLGDTAAPSPEFLSPELYPTYTMADLEAPSPEEALAFGSPETIEEPMAEAWGDWEAPVASTPTLESAPSSTPDISHWNPENIEVLATYPLDNQMGLLLVCHEALFALMGQLGGPNNSEVSVVKVFEHNPLEDADIFTAQKEGEAAGKQMFYTRIGNWQAIISTDNQAILLHTELQ